VTFQGKTSTHFFYRDNPVNFPGNTGISITRRFPGKLFNPGIYRDFLAGVSGKIPGIYR